TVNPGNEIIVKDSVATTTSASTFKNIAGFSDLGIGGPAVADGASGTVDMALLPSSINTLSYITGANGALKVIDVPSALTINTFDNGGGFPLTLACPSRPPDSPHSIIRNTS